MEKWVFATFEKYEFLSNSYQLIKADYNDSSFIE